MKKEILVGTASWSDPGFVADWYPKGLPANFYREDLCKIGDDFGLLKRELKKSKNGIQ